MTFTPTCMPVERSQCLRHTGRIIFFNSNTDLLEPHSVGKTVNSQSCTSIFCCNIFIFSASRGPEKMIKIGEGRLGILFSL